jgi:hypothetical protein
MLRRILGIAAISWIAVALAAACGNSSGDSGQDAAPTSDAAQDGDGTGGGDGAGGGDGNPTGDSPATGDDGGPVGDAPLLLDGPLCPPCMPKEICCGSTGKCYPAGCGSCCM